MSKRTRDGAFVSYFSVAIEAGFKGGQSLCFTKKSENGNEFKVNPDS